MLSTWYQACQPEVVRMAVRLPVKRGQGPPARPLAETKGRPAPGVPVLGAGVVLLVAGIVLLIRGIHHGAGAAHTILLVVAVLLLIAALLALHGLTPVVAGEAPVVELFCRDQGTVPAPGLQLVNPFTPRPEASVRGRYHQAANAKVNDAY